MLRTLLGKIFCCVNKATCRPVQHPVHKVCWMFLVALSLPKNWLHGCSLSNRCPDYPLHLLL